MILRKEKKEKARSKLGSLKSTKIRRILRTVSDNRAFYFYEGEGKPCSQVAKSLQDFCDKIHNVPHSSLVFHLKRKDFGNWFTQILEDPVLAKRTCKINVRHLDLKLKLHSTVYNRIRELKEVQSNPRKAPEDLSAILASPHVVRASAKPGSA